MYCDETEHTATFKNNSNMKNLHECTAPVTFQCQRNLATVVDAHIVSHCCDRDGASASGKPKTYTNRCSDIAL